MSRRHAVASLALAAAIVLPGTSLAQTLLTVSGKRGGAAQPGVALDLAALERLPQHSFSTSSPWTKKAHRYSGPLLRDVLALVGASGTRIRATALNEYQVTIPVEDARRFDVIVAHRIDGERIPVRERGPLFVIYPFDQVSELRSSRYYDRSIWQLKSMVIE